MVNKYLSRKRIPDTQFFKRAEKDITRANNWKLKKANWK